MKKIYPEKLQKGDGVRVVAPSLSMSIISPQVREIAARRFSEMGLAVSFGNHVEEKDDFNSSAIESRVADIHEAFADPKIKAVITIIGGFNSNQLLKYLDWQLIKSNPKIFCGYSDITVLNNAIFAKTGLVNYYGPHYSIFGQKLYLDYTLDYFKKCLMEDKAFEVAPSDYWSDEKWYLDQDKRELVNNEGPIIINEGLASGTILGGNLCTFNLLQGTEFFPQADEVILFIEDDEFGKELAHGEFDRNLQSLIHLPWFGAVRGIVIGRFQKASVMNAGKISHIVKSKKELNKLPVIANADFGHTEPRFTLPIGGQAKIAAQNGQSRIEIVQH